MQAAEYERMYALEGEHWWYVALREVVMWHVRRVAEGRRLRILDAGCGTGGMLQMLREVGEVVGIDGSERAVAYCRQRGLSEVTCEDLNTWEPRESAFDVIVCLDVLYHMGVADDVAVMRKFYAALVPGGMVILHLPAFECLRRAHDEVVMTRRRYTRKSAAQLACGGGFEVIGNCYRLWWLFFVALARKWRERVRNGYHEEESDLQPLPAWLNRILLGLARADNFFVRYGVSMPVGSSILLVGRKPTMSGVDGLESSGC
ncbi:MAG: class I SAM-dependent methyltransferase [bacterium]|nr:class I SAM-dependent methyltransferase [bacterium]